MRLFCIRCENGCAQSLFLLSESIATLSHNVRELKKVDTNRDEDDTITSVTSQEAVKIALTLPIPESLKGLNRSKLERYLIWVHLHHNRSRHCQSRPIIWLIAKYLCRDIISPVLKSKYDASIESHLVTLFPDWYTCRRCSVCLSCLHSTFKRTLPKSNRTPSKNGRGKKAMMLW